MNLFSQSSCTSSVGSWRQGWRFQQELSALLSPPQGSSTLPGAADIATKPHRSTHPRRVRSFASKVGRPVGPTGTGIYPRYKSAFSAILWIGDCLPQHLTQNCSWQYQEQMEKEASGVTHGIHCSFPASITQKHLALKKSGAW